MRHTVLTDINRLIHCTLIYNALSDRPTMRKEAWNVNDGDAGAMIALRRGEDSVLLHREREAAVYISANSKTGLQAA